MHQEVRTIKREGLHKYFVSAEFEAIIFLVNSLYFFHPFSLV